MKLVLLSALASNIALGSSLIKWRSQGMTVSLQEHVINLTDAVHIEQGELQVSADSARIYFDAGQRQIKREAITLIELQGRVSFSFGRGVKKISGRGDRAVFSPAETIVLSGNAEARQRGNVIRGTKIIYYLHTGWLKVSDAEGVITSRQQ